MTTAAAPAWIDAVLNHIAENQLANSASVARLLSCSESEAEACLRALSREGSVRAFSAGSGAGRYYVLSGAEALRRGVHGNGRQTSETKDSIGTGRAWRSLCYLSAPLSASLIEP